MTKSHSIGKKIRELRTSQNLTLKELATRAGVSIQTLWGVETKNRTPQKGTLVKIAHAIGTNSESLLAATKNTSAVTVIKNNNTESVAIKKSIGSLSLEDMLREINRRGFNVNIAPKAH